MNTLQMTTGFTAVQAECIHIVDNVDIVDLIDSNR